MYPTTIPAEFANRRPAPTGDGKRRAIESPPTLLPSDLTLITTASVDSIAAVCVDPGEASDDASDDADDRQKSISRAGG